MRSNESAEMMERSTVRRVLVNWWPAACVMAAIFALSAQPSDALPDLGWADALIKKGGHVLGYGALASAYWRALGWKPASFLDCLVAGHCLRVNRRTPSGLGGGPTRSCFGCGSVRRAGRIVGALADTPRPPSPGLVEIAVLAPELHAGPESLLHRLPGRFTQTQARCPRPRPSLRVDRSGCR